MYCVTFLLDLLTYSMCVTANVATPVEKKVDTSTSGTEETLQAIKRDSNGIDLNVNDR